MSVGIITSDELLQDAVVRNFEVIGEAVRYLSEATPARYPAVRWKDFIGFRNLLIKMIRLTGPSFG